MAATNSSSNVETAREADQQTLPRNVRLLGLSSLLNDVASEMIFPLLPKFILTLAGGSYLYLGAIEGLADTTASIIKLWSGSWSDRAGARKAFVVTGYALAALVRPLMGLAHAPWHVAAVRVTDRFGKGIRAAPRDALIADSTAPAMRGRAFGFNRAMDHLGAAIGPVLAAVFLYFRPDDMRILFLLTIIPGVIVVALIAIGLREQPIATQAGKKFSFTLAPLDWNFRIYLTALVIFTLGNSSDIFLLARAGQLGVPDYQLPLLWCAFHLIKSSGNYAAGFAVDRFGSRGMIVVGWAVYAAIYLAFALATSALQAWLFFLLYGLFYALTEPAERTLVANLAGDERKGLAFGWFNFAIGIVALPSSVIFGAIYDRFGAAAAFGWSAALAGAAVAVLFFVRVRPPQA